MSSSNAVKVAAIKETSYGVTPGAGDFKAVRFISESLTGTPETTESQQIRTDRMSSGQIVTSLTVGGDLAFELAKESALEDFMESAMLSTWNVLAPLSIDLEIDATLKKVIRTVGSFVTDGIVKGDFIVMSGWTTSANNVLALVVSVSALELEVITQFALADETKVGITVTRCDKLVIGTTKTSYSIEKIFTDLTTKAIQYKGMLVSTMSLAAAYGELMTGSFGFSGNGYKATNVAGDMITNGRTITPQATTPTLNGSIDMPFLASSATGAVLADGDLCIQSLSLDLDNNMADLTCIGKAEPENYDPGTAAISVAISTYLKDSSWALLPKKLTQESFELAFAVKNSSGGYGFYMPAIQVTGDDPASGGQNQQVSLSLEGMAKVGANGESALSIYRLPA